VLPSPQPDGSPEERPEREPYRCAFALGFSLHASVALTADNREALLRLVRYGARQAFSQQQLAELPDGRLRYTLKRPFGPGGARQLILEPQLELADGDEPSCDLVVAEPRAPPA
jgi:hypothetical protein